MVSGSTDKDMFVKVAIIPRNWQSYNLASISKYHTILSKCQLTKIMKIQFRSFSVEPSMILKPVDHFLAKGPRTMLLWSVGQTFI